MPMAQAAITTSDAQNNFKDSLQFDSNITHMGDASAY